MNILLFSNDENLAAFCREVLSDVFGAGSNVEIGIPGQSLGQEELCLWDFVPGETTVPRDLDVTGLHRHLFLLHRQHLPMLQALLGRSEFNILLKPVTPATLRAFLGEAERRSTHNTTAPAESEQSLRIERDEMLQFLIQANLKLQEYDHERTNFLARSIHDFRAPLTAISGYCSLLLDEELGSLTADQRDVLGRMQQSAKRLSRITNAMFQLSIRQRVDHELNLKKADMRECVDQALHEVALVLEDKRISLSVEIEPSPDGLFFDKSQIEQTLVNLLDNARKFTPRNGAIEIRGYPYFWDRRGYQSHSLDLAGDRRGQQIRTPNSFRVDIRDSGPGIPQVHIGKIFEEYSSYSGGQDRSGGGLGLAICRMILQQHGGQVWAESNAAGAVFSFVIPVHSPVLSRITSALPEADSRARAALAGVKEGWS
ncbi:MAG TPA: HAMP domain-containing sensor histidine kinase [Bryobacteraceae bacterium]|jgi:signal transduction histidine kinase|nr:HAMP domain-containing sensor histidine kinase [Bryobacteraceae bacterium]